MTSPLSSARRVVIKIGSSLLIDQTNGKPHTARFTALAADAAKLRAEGKAIVIVSSGAVALGRAALGLKAGKLRLEEKQAAAAAGQPRLMRAWGDALLDHDIPVAQALLTFDDTERRRRWLNARATLETLIERGAVPVVNENDTVATEEIRYGDNDRLAARVDERKWLEFTAYALFSPQSLIAEGTANFGIEVAFPGEERVAFEQNVLFPLAGLDGSRAELYYRIHSIFLKLGYAGNEAARRYLNGEIDREKAVEWLVNYALMSPERAQQRTKFFDQYRSYVINYNLGQDLVKKYIEKRGGTPDNPDRRWSEFEKLISSPRLPSGLL